MKPGKDSNKKKQGVRKRQKKQKLPLSRGDKILRGVIISLSVILALILVFLAWYMNVGKAPEVPSIPTSTSTGTGSDSVESNTGAPVVTGDRKENYYTFLVVGLDEVAGNTDTIMLVSYDVKNQKINVMSLPRDTMVNVAWDVKKINSVYNVGGMDMLKKEVSSLVGFEPDYTVIVNLEAFSALVDAIGGVDFDIPFKMYYDDPLQDLSIHFAAGMTHLGGEQARELIRFRKNNDGTHSDGDVGRIKLQQDFMTAVIKQCMNIKNVTKISEFADIFNQYVKTELTVDNILYFGKAAINGGLSTSNVNFCTLPNTTGDVWSRSYGAYLSYVFPKADELVDLINANFNPYQENVTTKNLDIMSVASNGKLSSTTGKLEDTKATSKASSSTKTSSSSKTSTSSSTSTSTKTTSASKTSTDSDTTSASDTSSESNTSSATDTSSPSDTSSATDTATDNDTSPVIDTSPATDTASTSDTATAP